MSEFRHVFLPYCLEPSRRRPGYWIVLNRQYQPVGLQRRGHVDYEDYAAPLRITRRTAAKLDLNAAKPPRTDGRIYLYDDGSVPTNSPANMRMYLDKLRVLAGLSMEA